MTVSSEVDYAIHSGTGSADTYTFNFRIFAASELRVVRADTEGNETVLALTTNYTVPTSSIDAASGQITLTAGNLPAGYTLLIRRVLPLTQGTDLRNTGAAYRETLERMQDRAIMLMQQLQNQLTRSFKLSEFDIGAGVATEMPQVSGKGGHAIFVNDDEDSLEFRDPGSVALATPGDGTVDADAMATAVVGMRLAARVVATASIDTTAPGATIDSLALSAGDRVLLSAQATASQNGLWTWNGAAVAMSRPDDYPSAGTTAAYKHLLVAVFEGTISGGTLWRCTTSGNITIGTDATDWAKVELAQNGSVQAATSASAPSATDDTDAGYVVGARWVRTSTPREIYLCVDASAGAAVWHRIDTPVGTLKPYAGSSEPSGWLLCDGSAVSRTTYADLFAVISTTYGAGDGSTTFAVPDLRGRVPAGLDDLGGTPANRLTDAQADVLGGSLGSEDASAAETDPHTLTEAEMPAHTHGIHHDANSGSGGVANRAKTDGSWQSNSTGGGGSHTHGLGSVPLVQPTMALSYIIKA